MEINGIQKLTLLDYPGRMACTVFLSGCDLRCPFCHNSELWGAAPAVMDDKELLSFLEKRRGMLEGVVFTGGEALLRPELPALIREVKALGFLVKLDTNGTHPERLRSLIDEGLADYIAMDVKNDLDRYALTCG
ncbi:MAG: anaerobic ribonucleoside-triphosphate reductase activating protein, partial [Clostridia bacterium]|nr:anaerobic ribonucleoside-triphosphate reductase activating protein [Clostridia bacterium]